MFTAMHSVEKSRNTLLAATLLVGALSIAACETPGPLEDKGERVTIFSAELLKGAHIRTSPRVSETKSYDVSEQNICATLDEINTITNADALKITLTGRAEVADPNSPWYRISPDSIKGPASDNIKANCRGPVYISIAAMFNPKDKTKNPPLIRPVTPQN